ncbi:MAG: glutamine synthetase family protein [Lachnospiraceae bacterium]|nr:glutamine synthetase family protein [Lachnospiraceae bacterium]
MRHYTKQDIIRRVEEEDVEFIRLQFTDMFGNFKNMAVTASQLEKVLSNQCVFNGSAIEGFLTMQEPDMVLYPDLDTFEIFPWRPQQGKVARFICDVCRPDGTPFEGDSRYILKKVVQEAKQLGYLFKAGPECEFFLFDLTQDGDATTLTKERGGFFDIGPVDAGENARREMVLTLEEMGFEVEASYHANAPAQHEIDFKYDDGLTTADNLMTFRMAVRTVARRHGLQATFMPKPRSGVDGSGMHLNLSLHDKNGANIFSDEAAQNGLSREGVYFIAGLLKHIDAITAITNPLVNSYKRLVPGYGAPVYVAWSAAANRSALVRTGLKNGKVNRIELRSPDPSANPYLALAVCLAAGLDGIKNRQLPPVQVDGNIYAMTDAERAELGIRSLPEHLACALDALEKDELLRNVLGERLFGSYLAAKRAEWREYRTTVSEWEVSQYLNRF